MRTKFTFLFTALIILASATPAVAQQTGKVWRIGFITPGALKPFKPRLAAFRKGLKALGYVDGKNIAIEERYVEGRRDRLPALAAQLVGLKVDIIVSHGIQGPVARAAQNAEKPIPHVFAVTANPFIGGFVKSLARPGGNVTGLSDSHDDLVAKRLELLKQIAPTAERVAVLWDPFVSHGPGQLKILQTAAPRLGVTLVPVAFSRPEDFDRVVSVIERERPDALNVFGWPLIAGFRKQVADLALRNRLPAIGTSARHPEVGTLMSYGVNHLDMYRRAATFVDRILKGAKPANIPVEQPTRFYLTVNLKTAKALGITFPPSFLLRADRVIE